MDANPQRPKDRDGVTSGLNRAENLTSVAATRAIFDPVRTLLTIDQGTIAILLCDLHQAYT